MNKTVIISESQIIRSHKNVHEPYEYYKQEITNREHFNQLYAAFYEIPPQKSNYPFHYHEKNTELFYIIAGKGLIRTGEGVAVVEAGDVIICPPGENGGHKLTNISDSEVLRYLDVDTTNTPDILHYPDSDKIGIIKHNESSTFYKDGKETDYYGGE